jgi:hypothetical protein
MPKGMQALYSYTTPTSGIGEINFTNIPQTYTDLMIVCSLRDVATSGINSAVIGFMFNFDATSANLMSGTTLKGTGSSTLSDRGSNLQYYAQAFQTNPSYTSNTFSSTTFYVPNYSGNLFKQILIDNVTENNATASNLMLGSALYRSTAPVNAIKFYDAGGPYQFLINSTITIYGISK